jgi:hypothetical protein
VRVKTRTAPPENTQKRTNLGLLWFFWSKLHAKLAPKECDAPKSTAPEKLHPNAAQAQ